MNIQHQSRDDSWMTPLYLLYMVREVLGTIDLDPASSAVANARIGARHYYDEATDGLASPWGGTVFCNPPGGKDGNKSRTGLFWQKLMASVACNDIDHAIFLFFSAEGIQNTQGKIGPSAGDFPLCIPAKRIRFDHPVTGEPGTSPSHSNAIVYVPGAIDRTEQFAHVFSKIGSILVPYRSAA